MEVIVRIVKSNPWIREVKWDNSYDFIGTYWTRSGALYTGLTQENQERLEKELGYEKGHLSQSSKFWNTFAIKIGKKELILNTEQPEHELQYLFLLGHKRVANGLANVTPSTDYVLINKDSEAAEANRNSKNKRDAYRELDKMSIEDMRKCLRLYGMKSDTMSNELIEAKLTEKIEENPKLFTLKWIKNPNKDMQFIVEEALSKNILRKSRSQYFFGTDQIGNGLEDCIAYLKDKKNQDILVSIKNEIKSK